MTTHAPECNRLLASLPADEYERLPASRNDSDQAGHDGSSPGRSGGLGLLPRHVRRVLEAADCAEAHELASTEMPDAIVTDAELPTLDILRSRFAGDEALRRVPLVIVDGEAETLQPLDGVTVIRDFDSLAPRLRRAPTSSGAMNPA